MSAMASQITSLTIAYSTVYSGAYQRKHQGSASLAFVRGIHRWPVNSPHKGPVTRKMFPFDDVIIILKNWYWYVMLYTRYHCDLQWLLVDCRWGILQHINLNSSAKACNRLENNYLECQVCIVKWTHCGLVMPYGDIKLGQHWLRPCRQCNAQYFSWEFQDPQYIIISGRNIRTS